jgi:hypothetical protein
VTLLFRQIPPMKDVFGPAKTLLRRSFSLRYRVAVSLVLAAFAALPGPAFGSQMIDRNATGVSLAVNRSGIALVTYHSNGQLHHTLAWGAINARTPTRGARQVTFTIDYSGGWASHHQDVWRGFRNACGPYQGPHLEWMVSACTAPDGSNWALQKWQRMLPPFGLRPTPAQSSVELHLSHWSGDLPEFVVKTDWVYREYDHLYGWLTYRGKGVYGFKSSTYGAVLDTWGRNVFVDTYNSRYGPGWRRENGFLTHRGTGAFCYGFYPHWNRPTGKGEFYRATVMGPGVTPILFWTGPAPGPYNAQIDAAANAEQATLFKHAYCREK